MEQYLTQLIEDLRAQHGQMPEKPNLRALVPDPQYPDVMEGAMEYLYGPQWEMRELFGIEAHAFPPAGQLSEAQTDRLVAEILALWGSFNLGISVPEGLPGRLLYPELLRTWAEEPVALASEGLVTIEFCDYEPSGCPWGGDWCMCKSFAEGSNSDDPFSGFDTSF